MTTMGESPILNILSPTALWPPAAILALQILFYTMLSFILLYLVVHWVFHTWSFYNIFLLSGERRRDKPDSWSYRWMPALVVFMFLFYTIYIGSFIWMSVVLLQFKKYFMGFFRVASEGQRHAVGALMYIFFGLALCPVVINMFAAIIKLTCDAIYSRKVEKNFREQGGVNEEPGSPVTGAGAPSPPEPIQMQESPPASLYHDNVGASRDIHLNLQDIHPNEDLPLVYIFIPVYNEPLPNLLGALNGVAAQDYPRLRCVVGFDNYDVELVVNTLHRLLSGEKVVPPSPPEQNSEMFSTSIRSAVRHTRKLHLEKYNGLHQLAYERPMSQRYSSYTTSTDRTNSSSLGSPSSNPSSARSSSSYSTTLTDVSGKPAPSMCRAMNLSKENLCPEEVSVIYRNVLFSLNRFEHGGKLATQRKMYEKLRAKLATESVDTNPLILFMDSDTAILPNTVSQLVGELSRYPQSKACTGFCVSRNEGSYSFWRILQDAEYIESMIFRNAESLMGSVTCLPGVLTMFRWRTLCEVSQEYFYQKEITSTYDFCQRYLGEDRYLTHILMETSGWNALGFNSKAVCKTEAPSNFKNLLRQRRRWFLGTITNEVIMLCTPGLWAKFPLLLATKLLQMLKVGGAFAYILFVEVLFNLIFDRYRPEYGLMIWLGAIIVPNWLFITVWCILERRVKGAFFFPIYYWFNPLFMMLILLYSFITVKERTWGGPRADAAKVEDDEECGSVSPIPSDDMISPPATDAEPIVTGSNAV